MSQADRPKPFQPRGAVDGKCVDSTLASNMKLWGKWGSSGEIPFETEPFFKEHPIWDYLRPYLLDRPNQPWTLFAFAEQLRGGKRRKHSLKKRRKRGKKQTKKNK